MLQVAGMKCKRTGILNHHIGGKERDAILFELGTTVALKNFVKKIKKQNAAISNKPARQLVQVAVLCHVAGWQLKIR